MGALLEDRYLTIILSTLYIFEFKEIKVFSFKLPREQLLLFFLNKIKIRGGGKDFFMPYLSGML